MNIYEPREDSYLLNKYVKKYAKGTFLDLGTGTGIQGYTAAKYCDKVVCVDINPSALKSVKLLVKKQKITNIEVVKSNLFENVSGKFDVIAFNPPYLPSEKNVSDTSLFSGKKGIKITQLFLDDVEKYMEDDGKILLISSSLSSQSLLKETLEKNLFSIKIIEKQHYFFEDIFLFEIKKSDVLLMLKKMNVKNSKLIAKGKRGFIIKGVYKNKVVAIKVKNEQAEIDSISHESNIIKELNKNNIGPRIINSSKKHMMYEFIEGEYILDFIEKAEKNTIKKILIEIFQELYLLDKLGINKYEMHRPHKHIIISKEKPFQIDFDRARYTKNPKNVTQFFQYLTKEKLHQLMEKKGFSYKKENIRTFAREYKKTYSRKKLFEFITKMLS